MSKKIVIVTDAWHPQVNGVVTVLDNTIAELKKREFQVVVVHPGLFYNIPLFFYKEIRLSLFIKNKIKKIFDIERPDYIHLVTEGPLCLAARAYCIKNGKNFTTAYHTHFALYIELRVNKFFAKSVYKMVYQYIRWFHSRAVRTMVATESLKKDLADRSFGHLVICPLGIDLELFKKNVSASIPSGLSKPIFVYFGRLAVEKNVVAFLNLKLPGSKLIIGDGPLRKTMEEKYRENILFVGYKKGQELVDLLSISNVFVFPSKTETFGLVVLEAMACGIPVAAYNVMGPRDIISNGVDGYVGDNLVENAIKCLDLLPENCLMKAQQYSWAKFTTEFISQLADA